jgi:hypothetical protein
MSISPSTRCRPTPATGPGSTPRTPGLAYEQLMAADLSKSQRNGGKYSFTADAWLPPDALRGELAEKWELKQNPLRVEVQLRKGVMFPAKAGVMESRELTSDDVVFSFDRLNKSPKKIPGYFDHVEKVEATGKHSVVMTLQAVQRRMGLPLRLGLLQRHHAQGSGGRRPRQLEERQRHRPVPAAGIRAGQLAHLHQEPRVLGQGEDRRRRAQAALRRQDHLPGHQGRADLRHRAAHRPSSTCWSPCAGAMSTR